ncbi:pseudaminic acid biosynthesis-associated methylase [Shewanella sp. 10N.261.52.F9]|uniref:pseudaminic acid biosynthesis-associated methylase n=1 Tax=Shewanella sp. 10N.261.52.F9 TaxID=3229684 RepID=UPI00354BF3D0
MAYKTEQESFWAGEFGNEYIKRNQGAELLASNLALFTRIFSRTEKIGSLIEFGANIGMNIQAFKQLLPNSELSAIEINATAVEQLKQIPELTVIHDSLLTFAPERQYEMTFIKGVLIHINPEALAEVYSALYNASARYICIVEYYNPSPVEVPYRGHSGKLFKRDFAGEMLDKYADLKLVDYGFSYHRDRLFPQDDLTWFLLEKSSTQA